MMSIANNNLKKQRHTLSVRNSQIRKEYLKEYKNGLRNEVIVKRLSEKYFLSVHTVEAIVFKKGVYGEF